MVAAIKSGPFLQADRQRAARTRRAVESAPPETARMTRPRPGTMANKAAVSWSAIGAGRSAADTLLFPLDALLHAQRCAGIFGGNRRERATGSIPLAQQSQ